MKVLFSYFKKMNVILFIVLFIFSVLLINSMTVFDRMNVGKVIKGFENNNLENEIYLLIDDMKAQHIDGPLKKDQREWLLRRTVLYGVMLQFVSADQTKTWFNSFQSKQGKPLNTALHMPYILNGSVIGYVTVAYSSEEDALNPIYVHYMNMMKERSRYLLFGMIIASAVFSFVVSKLLINPLNRLSNRVSRIRFGDKRINAPERGPEEVRKLAETLNQMSLELIKQEEWRKHLVEDLAHELRTPLTSMMSQIEALIDGVFDTTEERLNGIYEELERLSRLLSDLQKLSEAESAQFTLNLKRTNMVELARRVYNNFIPLAYEKGIELAFDSTNVPCEAYVDRDKMIQILSNIISNAIKYTQDGGHVQIRVDWQYELTTITCKDTGVGIWEEDLPYIFNRLYRTDKSRSRFSGGVGLGLSIAKAFAEAQNIQIEVQSVLGQGSVFKLVIPNDFD